MKRIILSGLALLAFYSLAAAQDRPRVVLFAGYSNASIKPASSFGRVVGYGWDINAAIRIPVVELVADLSGHYGSLSGTPLNVHTLLFGPRFSYHGKHISIFVHSLYGISRIEVDDGALASVFHGRPDTGFAFVPGGGGVDIRITRNFYLRPIEFDLVFNNWLRDSQLQTRVSMGLAFQFGKK